MHKKQSFCIVPDWCAHSVVVCGIVHRKSTSSRLPLSYSSMRLYFSLFYIHFFVDTWWIHLVYGSFCGHIPNDLQHSKLFVTVCVSLSVSQWNNSLLCFRPFSSVLFCRSSWLVCRGVWVKMHSNPKPWNLSMCWSLSVPWLFELCVESSDMLTGL